MAPFPPPSSNGRCSAPSKSFLATASDDAPAGLRLDRAWFGRSHGSCGSWTPRLARSKCPPFKGNADS
jgi:hypothetical protein